MAPFMTMGVVVNIVSGKTVLKTGENSAMTMINKSAVSKVESSNKVFFPPHMTKAERNAIGKPARGLIIVWCTDCNSSASQKSRELFAYSGNGESWIPFSFLTTSSLTTGKKVDANKPVKLGAAGASIFGTLGSIYGDIPTETGIVYREIMSNDFARVPVLDALGNATIPTYKAVGALVTTARNAISVNIPAPSSTTGSIGYRTNTDGSVVNAGVEVFYRISTAGSNSKIVTRFIDNYYSIFYTTHSCSIGYSVRCNADVTKNLVAGDDTVATIVATIEPISKQLIYNEVATTVNFIRVHFNVTEVGKYDSFVASDPTGITKGLSLATVPAGSFATTGDYTLDFVVNGTSTDLLAGNSFVVSRIGTPLQTGIILQNPVTDSTAAIATVTSVENLITGTPFKIGVAGSGTIKVNFDVTSSGTCAGFVSQFTSGATTGFSVAAKPAGISDAGKQSLTFTVSVTPLNSLEGNSFIISRIGTPFSTGAVLPDSVTGSAVATVTAVDSISNAFHLGESANATIRGHFNVSSPGTHAGFATTATSGLYVAPIAADSFTATGDQPLDFTVSGIAGTLPEGNSFTISRIIAQPLKNRSDFAKIVLIKE